MKETFIEGSSSNPITHNILSEHLLKEKNQGKRPEMTINGNGSTNVPEVRYRWDLVGSYASRVTV